MVDTGQCFALELKYDCDTVTENCLLLLLQEDQHKDWVSCVRFSPNAQNPIIVSCGWDRIVKVSKSTVFILCACNILASGDAFALLTHLAPDQHTALSLQNPMCREVKMSNDPGIQL